MFLKAKARVLEMRQMHQKGVMGLKISFSLSNHLTG
jgi:hypothetical protein